MDGNSATYTPLNTRTTLRTGYTPVRTRSSGYTPLSTRGFAPVAGVGNRDALSAAFDLIKQEEGLRTEAYQDQTGRWTIGFGNTTINGRPVRPGDRISEDQAARLMRDSVIQRYTTFSRRVRSQLSPSQFAALTSFEYNLGSGVWNDATGRQILSLVDAGDFRGAGQLMLQYNKSRNAQTRALERNPVLAGRRRREARLLAMQSTEHSGEDDEEPELELPRGYTPLSERLT